MEYKLSEQELKDLMHRTWLKAKNFYKGQTDEYFYDHFENEKKQLLIQHVVSSATECRHNSQQEKLNVLKWFDFAENEIANGRKQEQCSKCKKWYFPSEM